VISVTSSDFQFATAGNSPEAGHRCNIDQALPKTQCQTAALVKNTNSRAKSRGESCFVDEKDRTKRHSITDDNEKCECRRFAYFRKNDAQAYEQHRLLQNHEGFKNTSFNHHRQDNANLSYIVCRIAFNTLTTAEQCLHGTEVWLCDNAA
jgi:hypothetical protein